MDDTLRRGMLRYYEERAPEYEDAYLKGTGTSSITDPAVFTREIVQLGPVVERCAGGRLIDLACGTGFWLPHYAARCDSCTLLDQSERMLDQARRRVDSLGIPHKITMVRADFFDYTFPQEAFDSVLAGFFLSHLTEEQEPRFFDAVRLMLAPGGRFLILDSAWTAERAAVNRKAERQPRRLNDGTPFEIYKRYFDRQDAARWERLFGGSLAIEHFGAAFLAVSGQLDRSGRSDRSSRSARSDLRPPSSASSRMCVS